MNRAQLETTGATSSLVGVSAVAWVGMLAISALPEVVAVEVFGWQDPPGAWMRLSTASVLVLVASVWDGAAPLRPFFVVMTAVIVLDDYLIGWLGGLLEVEGTSALVAVVTGYTLPFFLLAVAFMAFLVFGLRLSPRESYLRVGALRGPSPVHLPGMRRALGWATVGIVLTVLFGGMIGMALLAGSGGGVSFEPVVSLIPLVIASAFFNSFAEEVVMRAGPLAALTPVMGTGQAVLLTSTWFGVAHWLEGIPSGLPGAVGSAAFGAALGWTMVKARGLGWPVVIHFVADAMIMVSIAAAL